MFLEAENGLMNDKAKHRLNKKYLLYTGGIYLCFYHHSYIIDKTFFKLQ